MSAWRKELAPVSTTRSRPSATRSSQGDAAGGHQAADRRRRRAYHPGVPTASAATPAGRSGRCDRRTDHGGHLGRGRDASRRRVHTRATALDALGGHPLLTSSSTARGAPTFARDQRDRQVLARQVLAPGSLGHLLVRRRRSRWGGHGDQFGQLGARVGEADVLADADVWWGCSAPPRRPTLCLPGPVVGEIRPVGPRAVPSTPAAANAGRQCLVCRAARRTRNGTSSRSVASVSRPTPNNDVSQPPARSTTSKIPYKIGQAMPRPQPACAYRRHARP